MSALFGHVRGAFTGAVSDRAGLLRKADHGLLLLDEIGLDEQAMLLRAIEEKVFVPLGSDREVGSEFQLIAGTNRDLAARVREGLFREDLLARINLWSFRIPGLSARREDIEPNLAFELEGVAQRTGDRVTFSREALQRFLAFAGSPGTAWTGNFRDLNGAVQRMATLAAGGRISIEGVEEEIARLRAAWAAPEAGEGSGRLTAVLGPARVAQLDRFDRIQLEDVAAVCSQSRSLSEAGRTLFEASRARKASTNDADRLRKYLARFGLHWSDFQGERGAQEGQPALP